ncbi:hypothetical protein [Magnetospirillum sp. SS-4]|uniref:hypothetical protein n=1 Tax=Magnetospirillum sp. SS-4 TaxID=2681465 RepID=UPI00137EE922|nr:hypothetical protein [Magnetospirillum sp. SS-4]CAA7622377.1 conserved exported hypothetical protein [Magnetospirillum sp. SS-4]
MRLLSVMAALALLTVVAAKPAAAVESAIELLDAPVSYTADFTLTGPRGTYRGKVWHAKGRERREVATSGGGQGVLIQRDTGNAYLLGLSGRWYVGLSLAAAGAFAGGLDGWTVTRTKVGDEIVGGIRATRWKARADGPKGGFSGHVWTSRDGIVVKAAGTIDKASGDDQAVEMVLSGLKVGSVDARLLELPQGWFGLDLRKLPAERVAQAIEAAKPLLEGNGGR